MTARRTATGCVLLFTSLLLVGCAARTTSSTTVPAPSASTAAEPGADLEEAVSAAETELNALDKDFQLDEDFRQ